MSTNDDSLSPPPKAERPSSKISVFCEVDGQRTAGFALRRDLGRHERMARAGRMMAIFTGIALLTVFIPILHFVLPPLFILGGVVFGATTWMETSEILEGEIACPNCRTVIRFPREAEDWPKTQRCPGCSYTLTIKT